MGDSAAQLDNPTILSHVVGLVFIINCKSRLVVCSLV